MHDLWALLFGLHLSRGQPMGQACIPRGSCGAATRRSLSPSILRPHCSWEPSFVNLGLWVTFQIQTLAGSVNLCDRQSFGRQGYCSPLTGAACAPATVPSCITSVLLFHLARAREVSASLCEGLRGELRACRLAEEDGSAVTTLCSWSHGVAGREK